MYSLLAAAVIACSTYTLKDEVDPTQYYEVVVDEETCTISLVELNKLCLAPTGAGGVPLPDPDYPTGSGIGSGGAGGGDSTASDN